MAFEFLNSMLNEASLNEIKKPNLKRISYKNLIPNAKNYFEISDIETLADDIEDNGLLQNLVVKELDGINYTIVVGHRRYEAIKMLVEERGANNFAEINCLIISKDEDELLTEYKLITSNLTHRGGFTALETADKLQTVKRLTEIFKEMKERGFAIKGKMRDLVAETLEISSIQTQKYQSILKSDDSIIEAVRNNNVSVNDAYEFVNKGVTELPPKLDNYSIRGNSVTPTPSLEEYQENFRMNLQFKIGNNVKITKNKVTFSYAGRQDLIRIAKELDVYLDK